MLSKLDQLKAMSIVVADTGDIEAVRRLQPQDCTTNPSLLLRAVQSGAHASIVDEAIAFGRGLKGTREEIIARVADRLAVNFGIELARSVPGHVSTEVDADLSFDTHATVAKAHTLIQDYEERGVSRDRILIKIAATWEGIRAAEILQNQGIKTNLTLLFSLVQASACADAGVFLISPFVGRILDWHVKNGGGPYTGETDPGILSVRNIYAYYKRHGIKTIVMGASFRNIAQVEALAGCDRLTISPSLIDELAAREGYLSSALSPEYVQEAPPRLQLDEKAFRFMLNEDAMATEKLAEGIRAFVQDLYSLRALISDRLTL